MPPVLICIPMSVLGRKEQKKNCRYRLILFCRFLSVVLFKFLLTKWWTICFFFCLLLVWFEGILSEYANKCDTGLDVLDTALALFFFYSWWRCNKCWLLHDGDSMMIPSLFVWRSRITLKARPKNVFRLIGFLAHKTNQQIGLFHLATSYRTTKSTIYGKIKIGQKRPFEYTNIGMCINTNTHIAQLARELLTQILVTY